MKRLFKLLIPLALSISFSVLAFAGTDENKNYIPLRDAFENNHATVKYDVNNNSITVISGDNIYAYNFNKNMYALNNTTLQLKYPLINIDNRVYIHYDDVAFLYEQPNDIYKNSKKNIVTNIYNAKKSRSVPGITFSFVDVSNNYTWIETFGYSDLENQVPVTENTLFGIGSTTKSFTALAILKLVEENKLNLDEKVTTYLPNFKLKTNPIYGGNSDDITLRMLLAHYSGINSDYWGGFFTNDGYYKDYFNNYINNIKTEYMTSVSGTRYSYSNSGYTVLGYLIGNLTNQNDIFAGYSTFIKDKILNPIGMTNSAIDISDSQKSMVASIYTSDKDAKLKPQYLSPTPAGALFSNAVDMGKFLNFMLNKGTINNTVVLKTDSINTMIAKSNFSDNLSTLVNGLGTFEAPFNNRTYVGHNGSTGYFVTDYRLDYENNTGVFISTNSLSAFGLPDLLTVFTLDNIHNEKHNLPPTDFATIKTNNSTLNGIVKDLKTYEGYYMNFGNIYFDKNNNMAIEGFDFIFTKTNDNNYYNENFGNVSFITIDNIDVLLLEGQIFAQKVNLNKADTSFDSWIGDYKAVKTLPNEVIIKDGISILKDNDSTFAIITSSGAPILTTPIYKIDDDRYIIPGVGRDFAIVITKSIKYGKTIIHYSGMDFEKQ